MRKVIASLKFQQEFEVEDDATVEDINTQFKELMGDFEVHGGGIDSLIKITEVRGKKKTVLISLDELADEVVLPEMKTFPGDKLTLDEITEMAHKSDHRANKVNVRLALGKLESSGDVIELDPEHWTAVHG